MAVETRSKVVDRRSLRRTAVLRLTDGGRPLLRARSLLTLDRFPPGARAALLVGDEPIGSVLRDARLETRRELLEITGDEATADDADELDIREGSLVFERTYRIVSDAREMAVITERFPASLFDPEAA